MHEQPHLIHIDKGHNKAWLRIGNVILLSLVVLPSDLISDAQVFFVGRQRCLQLLLLAPAGPFPQQFLPQVASFHGPNLPGHPISAHFVAANHSCIPPRLGCLAAGHCGCRCHFATMPYALACPLAIASLLCTHALPCYMPWASMLAGRARQCPQPWWVQHLWSMLTLVCAHQSLQFQLSSCGYSWPCVQAQDSRCLHRTYVHYPHFPWFMQSSSPGFKGSQLQFSVVHCLVAVPSRGNSRVRTSGRNGKWGKGKSDGNGWGAIGWHIKHAIWSSSLSVTSADWNGGSLTHFFHGSGHSCLRTNSSQWNIFWCSLQFAVRVLLCKPKIDTACHPQTVSWCFPLPWAVITALNRCPDQCQQCLGEDSGCAQAPWQEQASAPELHRQGLSGWWALAPPQ